MKLNLSTAAVHSRLLSTHTVSQLCIATEPKRPTLDRPRSSLEFAIAAAVHVGLALLPRGPGLFPATVQRQRGAGAETLQRAEAVGTRENVAIDSDPRELSIYPPRSRTMKVLAYLCVVALLFAVASAKSIPITDDAKDSVECTICSFIVGEVEKELAKNSSEGEIEAALTKLCNDLPKSISGAVSVDRFG